jgi:hypothetical protein
MPADFVAPTDLHDFARSLGWQAMPEAIAGGRYVMSNPHFPRRQIVIPLDFNVPGYDEASSVAVEKLADMHKLGIADTLDRVRTLGDDLMRFRVTGSRATDHSLPLSFAAHMLRGVEEVLLSSACTVLRSLTHHPNLHREPAVRLIEHTRLGHTQRGSFVLQVSCPVDAIALPSLRLRSDVKGSFVRASMIAARNGVHQLVRAIETETLDAFVDSQRTAASPVVSANLCEALGRLNDERIRNSVDLSFRWAPRIPLGEEFAPAEVIRIKSGYFGRIEEVRRALRSTEDERTHVFVGTVVQLDYYLDLAGQPVGEAVVALLLPEGEVVRARVTLNVADYQRAVSAHLTEHSFVRIEGILSTGRELRTLDHVTSFTLVGPP